MHYFIQISIRSVMHVSATHGKFMMHMPMQLVLRQVWADHRM